MWGSRIFSQKTRISHGIRKGNPPPDGFFQIVAQICQVHGKRVEEARNPWESLGKHGTENAVDPEVKASKTNGCPLKKDCFNRKYMEITSFNHSFLGDVLVFWGVGLDLLCPQERVDGS